MVTQNKVFDLAQEGSGFVPLSITSTHRLSLRAAVLAEIRAVPGGVRTALSAYSTERTSWDIPPLYAGHFRGVSLQASADRPKSRLACPYEEYLQVLRQFQANGWDQRTLSMLARRLGPLGAHPMVFDRSSTSLPKFAVQYAMTLSRRFAKGLILQNDTAAVRVPTKEGWKIIGLERGEVRAMPGHEPLMPSDLYDWLLGSRGLVKTVKYGTYDRVLRWAELNYESVSNVDELRLALSLLKLSCKEEEEWEFEHAIRYASGQEIEVRQENPYTEERLDEIRSAWIDAPGETEEDALQSLFEALCPKYIDSKEFKATFGVLPEQDLKLTARQVTAIDRGVDRYALSFMSKARNFDK